mgnify:CR=1 FL=1
MPITPKPLQIEVYCKDCGTYLESKWDNAHESPEIIVEVCQCPLNEVRKVYEKYKHLDRLLCDRKLADSTENMPYYIACDLWQAIKAACEPVKETEDE